MNAERYKKVDDLFDAALELDASRRASFLEKICGSDTELRCEVESLLAAYDKAEKFIETPAMEVAAISIAQKNSSSHLAEQIGHYRIIALIGEGGMGEVYLAEDTRLNRKIALKILPIQFTKEADRVARFQRESRAASALNHPNIITIFEIGQDQNIHFIASEYIEGDTLRQKLGRGKLRIKEAIEITLQIASALAAAHSAGLVHRDIKPENIMIRHDGYIKVLDFGLVKLLETTDTESNHQDELSLSTQTGMVMGTISYMSPEQALGHDVDHRTDIFSLGVVLYEMVTGQLPFKGNTAASTFDAILNKQPTPVTGSNPAVSFEFERVILRMLEKDSELRYQTATDLRAVLKRLQHNIDSDITASTNITSTSSTRAAQKTVSHWWMKAALVLSLITMLLATAWLFFLRSYTSTAMPQWQDAIARKITDLQGAELFPSLSPDGKSLIYVSRQAGNLDIYLKRIGSRKISNLTEGSIADETQPVFSPDGKRIVFRRTAREKSGIYIMSETGESVRQLTDYGFNPAWSPDGKEIVCTENSVETSGRSNIPSRMWLINSTTGESHVLTENDAVQASWSPHSYRIAYWGVHKGAQRDIWTIPAIGGEAVQVTDDAFVDWNPMWSPDGKYLYFISNRKGTMSLWRAVIDEKNGKVAGVPELVPTPSANIQHLSFSSDGRQLAFAQSTYFQTIEKLSFDPLTEKILGQPADVLQSSGQISAPDISPDGQFLTYNSAGGEQNLFVLRIGSSTANQITDDPTNELNPQWSPDGKRLAYFSNQTGTYQIWTINSDGSGARQITEVDSPGAVLPIWSPDGSRLAYSLFGGKTFIMDLNKAWNDQTVVETADPLNQPSHFVAYEWSPDGKYLVGLYYKNRVAMGIATYIVADQTYNFITDFGNHPKWFADSHRFLFTDEDKILLVDTQTKKPRDIISLTPKRLSGINFSHDNRSIYLSITTTEADIWLMSLE